MASPDYDPRPTGSWLVCTACGTQFPTADRGAVTTCFICDDPRQFTPPTGQAFTTLDELRAGGYRNVWTPVPGGGETKTETPKTTTTKTTFTSIATEPRFAIGQRAILVRTPRGNVLWDCVTLLDGETAARVREAGGLDAIVISHPHYYSTHLEWARAFSCPVYLAAEDAGWLAQRDGDGDGGGGGGGGGRQVFIPEGVTEFDIPLPGDGGEEGKGEEVVQVKALKPGGHFPGSLLLLCEGRLLVADTFVTTPSGRGNWEADATGRARGGGGGDSSTSTSSSSDTDSGRPRGMNSFSFLWSIPNMIPLGPDELARMWRVVRPHEYHSTHGAFVGLDIVGLPPAAMRRRVLESMQIQVRHMGHAGHALLLEKAG